MIEHEYAPAALLTIRCACHMLIALRIFTYQPNNHRDHRHFVGFVAASFGGLNAMEALHIGISFQSISAAFEPFLTGVMMFVLMFVIWSGGNIARFIPHKLMQRLP